MPTREEHYLGNPLLKRSNIKVELTPEQLLELAKCSEDPIYFARNYIKIVNQNDGLVNFEPYSFQEEMLNNFYKNRFNVCKLPRQPLSIKTPIATVGGWKELFDIAIGDFVYDNNGNPVQVIHKTEVFHNTKCYKVIFNGETIVADFKHGWRIILNGEESHATTQDLYELKTKGYYLETIESQVPKEYSLDPKTRKTHKILDVQPTDSTPVQCLTVDSFDHVFLCGKSFIPTENCGKSTTAVSFIVHNLLFNELTSVAILANKQSSAKDVMSRLHTAYENLPKWMQQGVKSCNKQSLELENGSKVIASSTSASAVRGGTYNLLMLDEYAFVPEQIANTFMMSVYPTITSGKNSKIIVTSTPNGINHFYKLWVDAKEGRNGYHPQEINWYDVPGRDEKWRADQIANIGQKAFDQEFNTEFLGSSETLISGSKLSAITTKQAIRKRNSLDVYEEPKAGHVYVTMVDTARGVEKDYHAFVIIDITNPPYNVVAKYKNNELKPELYSDVVREVAFQYNQSFLLCEVNDIGNQVAKDLIDDEYPNMLLCSTKSRSGQFVGQNFSGKYELGVKMQKNIKKIGCLKLKTLIEENILMVNDLDIFSELTTFVQKGASFEAETGRHDDLVICLVMFSWLTTNQYFKDIIDIDLRQRLLAEKKDKEEEDVLPFGFAPFSEDVIVDEKTGDMWQVVEDEEMNTLLNLFNYY
jgi:hypothetical protein